MKRLPLALLTLTLTLLLAASASALGLNVSYDTPIRCGEETTFTLTATDAGEDCMYYLNCITLSYDGVFFDVLNNSTCAKSPFYTYRKDNTFSFTFMASGTYQMHFYVMDKTTLPAVTARKDITITISDNNYPTVETIADRIVAECKANTSNEYELALALHDYLINHTDYDYDLLYCHPEGVLVRGKGTCEAYQRAYGMLLNRAGITNTRA